MIVNFLSNSILVESSLEKLIGRPKIPIINKVCEAATDTLRKDLNEIEGSNQPIIPIVIDSYGGDVYALLAMIDLIRSCKKPVYTLTLGKAMSAGILLSASAVKGNRYIAETASVMIHEVSSFHYGKIEEVKANVKETERLNTLLFNLLDKFCEKEKGFFLDEIHKRKHTDWYLTPEEAIDLSLYDYIGIPFINIEISVDYYLGM